MAHTSIPSESDMEKAQVNIMKNDNPPDNSHNAGSVFVGPQQLDRICSALEDGNNATQRLGSTTAIGLGGFVLCTTPISMVLLGWQDATGLGSANLGSWIWLGGIITVIGAIGDWITGRTFPAIVFSLFGGFWLSFGTTLIPDAGAYGAYASDPSNPAEGLTSPAFYSTFAFFLIAMALLCFIFLLASLRISIAFFMAFATLTPSLCCLAASFWAVADGRAVKALTLQHAAAGLLLTTSFIGWYILAALILPTVDFPVPLPLGDLSRVIKGANERNRKIVDSIDS